MSVATEISRLQTAKADLKTAIEAKGVTVPSATKIDGYATLVGQIQTGGGPSGPVERKDVNFYDYEGTVLYSYTKSEFLALESMPSNPSHTGLTARGWNWTLANAKTYVTDNGKLEIGQMYYPASGKTEFHIRIHPNFLTIGLDYNQGTANGVTIEWGDGTTTTMGSTGRRTPYHTYSEGGDYVLKINVTTGTFSLRGPCILYERTALRKVFLAQNMGDFGGAVFQNMYNLEEVTIGNATTLTRYAFQYCRSLKHITIPNTVTSFDSYDQQFGACTSLRTVSLPKEIATWGTNIFGDCQSLLAITIPPVAQNVPFKLCYNCRSLREVTIPKEATGINGEVFRYCNALDSVKFPQNLTSINTYAFSECSSLHEIDLSATQGKGIVLYHDCFRSAPLTKVILPTDATLNAGFQFADCIASIGMANNDSNMSNINADFIVNFPNITTIDQAAFYNSFVTKVIDLGTITAIPNSNGNRGVFSNCYFLQSAKLPSTITSIGDRAFYNCPRMETLFVLAETPPTLANTNAISGSTTLIYVPEDSVSDYQAASGWSSFASIIVGLPECWSTISMYEGGVFDSFQFVPWMSWSEFIKTAFNPFISGGVRIAFMEDGNGGVLVQYEDEAPQQLWTSYDGYSEIDPVVSTNSISEGLIYMGVEIV